MLAKENIESFSVKKTISNGSSTKKRVTPGRKFGEVQSPNISNMSGTSARSGEFYTPTGTIEISASHISEDISTMGDDAANTSVDLSKNVLTVLNQRRMTVDAATAFGIISDLEKAQSEFR